MLDIEDSLGQEQHTTRINRAQPIMPVTEGVYSVEVCEERHEVLLAHPLSGHPRFPWLVSELLAWGGRFVRLLSLLLFIGCAAPVSQQSVVNNTGALLDVFVDGKVHAQRLHTGQTISIPARMFYGETVVVVLAYEPYGTYIGADRWIFRTLQPEVWQVNGVLRPAASRKAW